MIVVGKPGRAFLLSVATVLTIVVTTASAVEDALSAHQQRLELPKEAVFKKVLENGLTILTKDSQPRDLTAIDITIKAGSSLEGEYAGSGISHFVEHMIFKGTKTRRPGDIEKEIKSYGGFINASTSHDLTSFTVTVPSAHLKETLSLLKDMFLNATFERLEFEKEREVILKEMKMNRDEPNARLSRLLYDTAYIGHPYKYPVIGYEEAFGALKREDLMRYYSRMYVPNGIVIAVVGGVAKIDLITAIEEEFKDFRRPDYRMEGSAVEPVQIAERRYEESMPISLSYLAIGFHSMRLLDTDLFAMDLLSMILGRGDNSRLNTILFKEKRMVHSISCWNYTPKDPGLFIVTAVLDKENLVAAEKAVLGDIDKLKKEGAKDDEMEAAKRMVLSDYLFSRQTLEAQARDISGNEVLTGDYAFSRRYVDGIQAVSKEDLKRVTNVYLRNENATIVRLVPPGFTIDETKSPIASMAEPIIKKGVLSNGLRILVREDRKTPTVSISVAMLAGLSVEDRRTNGVSNLTAMMLLKGTGSRKERDIKGALESRGGGIASFSGFNSFGVNLTLLKPDLDFALGILKDILTDSTFPKDELDKEKGLTLAMIKDEDDDIFERGVYLLRKNLFGDHPYGLRTIGEAESISSLKREDLLNFYRIYCRPENMVISISGDVEYESVVKKMKDAFGVMKSTTGPTIPAIGAGLAKALSQMVEMEKDQSLLLLGFKTASLKDDDRYPLELLGSVMSGSSGRLFHSLRDKRSLAYTLGCVQKFALDTGYLIFYVATTRERIAETKEALTEEIADIKERLIGDEELTLAKRELKSLHKIKMQTNDFFSFQAALDELYGLGYDNLYKYESRIDKVTRENIKEVANKYLNLGKSAQVIVTPPPAAKERTR